MGNGVLPVSLGSRRGKESSPARHFDQASLYLHDDLSLVNEMAMNNSIESPPTPAPWFGSIDVEAAAHLSAYEPFVDEQVVARILMLEPRRVVEMARKSEIPAHPIGGKRKTWRFRISEVSAHFSARSCRQGGAAITAATAATHGRKKSWAKVQ